MSSWFSSSKEAPVEDAPILGKDGSINDEGYQKTGDILIKPDKDPISGTPNSEYRSITINGQDFQYPLKQGVSHTFYFVTSWILFLQGISELSGLAVSYFYKNELKVDPAVLSTVTSLTALPWTIKPLYGLITDGWPIFGYRRKPYLIMCGIAGCIAWWVMSTMVNDVWFGFSMMFIASMAIGFSNVIAEGMIVEKSRGQSQEFASHLQATVHGAQAVGGIIAAYFSGMLLDYISNKQMFMLCAIFPLTLILVAVIYPEEKFTGDLASLRQGMGDKLNELFKAMMQPQILKPVAFVFMLNATPATGSTWFYFYTNTLGFTSGFLGTINVVGAVCSLGGVLLFGNFLANTPFRPILIWSTIISTVIGLTQLILVFRWNLQYGIPDGFFCLGESAVLSVLGWINTMPILVLASRLCPQGMEATMYALIMSVNNLGGVIGAQFGALITWQLGITDSNLDNFWLLVLICNLSTVIPLVFIGWIPADGKDYGAEMGGGQETESKPEHKE